MTDTPRPLVRIYATPGKIDLDIAYATPNNFTGKPVYGQPHCYLIDEAHDKLMKALDLAMQLGYKFKLFDAFRPQEAQVKLWDFCPNDTYITPPEKGSPHTRGVAIDLTLVDIKTGEELDMGTPFDDFTEESHHGCTTISPEAQKNRYILMGIMSSAGWDFYKNEWWHYQLFNAREKYPLRSDTELPESMMDSLQQTA